MVFFTHREMAMGIMSAAVRRQILAKQVSAVPTMTWILLTLQGRRFPAIAVSRQTKKYFASCSLRLRGENFLQE